MWVPVLGPGGWHLGSGTGDGAGTGAGGGGLVRRCSSKSGACAIDAGRCTQGHSVKPLLLRTLVDGQRSALGYKGTPCSNTVLRTYPEGNPGQDCLRVLSLSPSMDGRTGGIFAKRQAAQPSSGIPSPTQKAPAQGAHAEECTSTQMTAGAENWSTH